jgi:transcriptional regulator with XRE-family HTH domain
MRDMRRKNGGPNSAHYRATHLRDVVTQQGRTLVWLGEQCGVTPGQYSRICSGQRRATLAIARKSSELLGVPLPMLFVDVRDEA